MDEKRQAEAVPHAAGAAPAHPQAGGVRFTGKRRVGAVMRLLKGESLEIVAREMNATAAKLSEWRDTVQGGQDYSNQSLKPAFHSGATPSAWTRILTAAECE